MISKMQRSQILHFSGDILKLYFIPEQFVQNVNNLSTPAVLYLESHWQLAVSLFSLVDYDPLIRISSVIKILNKATLESGIEVAPGI